MGLYLGSNEKIKINLGNAIYIPNIFFASPIIEDTILASSDNYLLQDFNGLYLAPKEEK